MKEPSSKNEHVKLRVPLENGKAEGLLALRQKDGLYKIDNIPFYVYGVSDGDKVEAAPDEKGRLAIRRVAQKSGNRTLRFYLRDRLNAPTRTALLKRLQSLGCECELAKERLVAVSVPTSARMSRVLTFITARPDLEWEQGDP